MVSEVKVKLVGHSNFVRDNPRSDKFAVQKFHHVEFWCADATNTFKRQANIHAIASWLEAGSEW